VLSVLREVTAAVEAAAGDCPAMARALEALYARRRADIEAGKFLVKSLSPEQQDAWRLRMRDEAGDVAARLQPAMGACTRDQAVLDAIKAFQ
jgi:hypothetical protein